MHVIRELPLWSPLYLLDGQSFLRTDPFLSELSMTLGPQRAARILVGLTRLVAGHLQQATIVALDAATAGDLIGEPSPPIGTGMRFAVALPDPSVPYDRAFRGIVQDEEWRSGKKLLVVTDDIALRFEARGHWCVVISIANYRERAMKALARLYGILETSFDAPAARDAMVRAMIEASRRGTEQ